MLGADVARLSGLVQGAGRAWRVKAAPFLRELEHGPALRRAQPICVRHADPARTDRRVYALPLDRGAACPVAVDDRDRAHADNFHITHEFLAFMLGVRRAGITKAASSLQRRNSDSDTAAATFVS